MKKLIAGVVVAVALGSLAGCSNEADVVSKNISTDADNFRINRQIVFYNGITGEYVAEVTGFCSVGNDDPQNRLSVTCKVGDNAYIKDYLGLSDNVTWFALQADAANVSPDHYKVTFKPSIVVPSLEVN